MYLQINFLFLKMNTKKNIILNLNVNKCLQYNCSDYSVLESTTYISMYICMYIIIS